MAIRQKGNKWQVDVTVGGVRAPRVSCDTKVQAHKIEAEFKAKLLGGEDPSTFIQPVDMPVATKAGTLGELMRFTARQQWAGTKGERTALANADAWVKELGAERDVASIDVSVIMEVVDLWVDRGLAPGTINCKLAALSMMLRKAEERGLIARKPKMPRRKNYSGRLRYFDDAEVESLLKHVEWDGAVHSLFTVAVETGMRMGEMLALTFRDVDMKHGMIMLGRTKSDKRRGLPMTAACRAAIERLQPGRMPHDKVFEAAGSHQRIGNFTRSWKAKMGLPKDDEACLHTFRHTTCSRLMQAGVPVNVVQAWMGHANIQTTMRYAHLAPDSLALARVALEGGKLMPTDAASLVTSRHQPVTWSEARH